MSTDDTPRMRLPELRFVPVESLIPHERHDQERLAPLVQRLRDQGVLHNPPIVVPLTAAADRFVVLDGTHRATAARSADLPHMVVQVVRYEDPGVRLGTWRHALAGYPVAEFERALAAVEGLERAETDLRHARAVLARREAIAFVAYGPDRATTLHGGGDLHERNALFHAVVDVYRTRARFHRVASDVLAEARAEHPDVAAVVVFPRFEPDEVLELATSGARLPAGITRHVIPGRALRVNVPLDHLADRITPLAEKNAWLAEWLQAKVLQRRVRFYQESTVLFDE